MPDGTTVVHHEEHAEEHRHTIETLFAGTLVGGLVAAGAAALAIIALAGLFPRLLVSVATIGVGAAFLFEGAAIVSRLSDLLYEVTEGKSEAIELGAGTTGETLAGLAGVTLGILAILGVVPAILISSAAIIFGAGLVIGAGANMRINELTMGHREEHPMARSIAREAVKATTGLQVLAGLGAITLGILALAGVEPLTLTLVAMLGVAVVFLLTDTAVAGRMVTVFHHRR
jgi:hypothetical protein